MSTKKGSPLSEEKLREVELSFLESMRETVGLDVAAAEAGGMPRKWKGKDPPTPEETEQLRQYLRNVEAAIDHIRSGGSLGEAPEILWRGKAKSS